MVSFEGSLDGSRELSPEFLDRPDVSDMLRLCTPERGFNELISSKAVP